MKIILPYAYRPQRDAYDTDPIEFYATTYIPCCQESKWLIEGHNGLVVSPSYSGGSPSIHGVGNPCGMSLKFCPFCGVPVVQEHVLRGENKIPETTPINW